MIQLANSSREDVEPVNKLPENQPFEHEDLALSAVSSACWMERHVLAKHCSSLDVIGDCEIMNKDNEGLFGMWQLTLFLYRSQSGDGCSDS